MIAELLLLCREFLQTGLFAVGGGLATIPFLAKMAEKYPCWMTLEELADMIAVSESTPGPIGVNMATYTGFKVAGVPGALAATLSLALPAFVTMFFVAKALRKWRESRPLNACFRGLRPAVTGLIAAAGFSVMQIALLSGGAVRWVPLAMFAALFACTQLKPLKKIHPIAYICAAAGMGILLRL